MSDVAITVENLSKLYQIGAQQRHDTLRDALVSTFKRNGNGASNTDLWALKDVSFEVKRGEVVGVIGRNGAGKSTLLKILSRITEPTSGRVEIHGRVGSLLEVGTGFHPELTGRDNIFLNGAILGMKRWEIQRKFDEIVAFAEIEKFLDTPVKRYSSGMYVRLAFAVAAHLEPEILLVDEVLAVGDVEFQKKCLGKMGDVAQEGRTVMFVSHNLEVLQRLCPKSILLQHGRVECPSDSKSVVERYTALYKEAARAGQWIELSSASRTGTGQARFLRTRFTASPCDSVGRSMTDGALEVSVEVHSTVARRVGSLALTIYGMSGVKLVNADTMMLGQAVELPQGTALITLSIDSVHLNPGSYSIGLWLANPGSNVLDHIANAFTMEVVAGTEFTLGAAPTSDGVVSCRFSVQVRHPN